jgi:hypothetical protein
VPGTTYSPSLWFLLGNWRQKAAAQALLMLTEYGGKYRPSNVQRDQYGNLRYDIHGMSGAYRAHPLVLIVATQ